MPVRADRLRGFRAAALAESSAELPNPGRGWYHIYTLNAKPPKSAVPLEEEIWFYGSAPKERLALALIDLSAFRAGAVSDDALRRIDAILHHFRENDKQVVLRFVYDTQGTCSLTEPLTLALVEQHMRQTGAVIADHRDDILVSQGLFVGNWGEMHGSRFSDDLTLRRLAGTLHDSFGGVYLAVRTPALIRMLLADPAAGEHLAGRLALFNDGMLAGPTDLGTYSVLPRRKAGITGKWPRADELAWQHMNLCRVPNGGEAAEHEAPVGFRQAAAIMQKTHISYLNSVYHQAQLGYWQQENMDSTDCWDGCSGFDFIGRHLGYRFTVRDVSVSRKQELCIEIENCGFANLCLAADCFLTMETDQGQAETIKLSADPRRWAASERTIISAVLPPRDGRRGARALYLSLKWKADASPIYFANRGAADRLKIGELTDAD